MRHLLFISVITLLLAGCASSDNDSTAYSAKYTVILAGFDSKAALSIEEGLMELSGYNSHRISVKTHTHAEFWYKTDLGTAKMSRELNGLLDDLNLPAVVQFSGNTYTVTQVSGRSSKPNKGDDYQW